MPVKIRLQRHGKKGKPYYWIVAADGRSKRDGKYLEKLGAYNPNTDPATIELDRAIVLIEEKKEEEKKRVITEFPENLDVRVLNGRYGPYIAIGKKNFKIPKGQKPEELSLAECLNIAENSKTKKK